MTCMTSPDINSIEQCALPVTTIKALRRPRTWAHDVRLILKFYTVLKLNLYSKIDSQNEVGSSNTAKVLHSDNITWTE